MVLFTNSIVKRVLDTSCKTMSCGPLRDRSLRFGHFVISHFVIGHFVRPLREVNFVIGHFVRSLRDRPLRDEEKEKSNKRQLKDFFRPKLALFLPKIFEDPNISFYIQIFSETLI